MEWINILFISIYHLTKSIECIGDKVNQFMTFTVSSYVSYSMNFVDSLNIIQTY